MVRKRDKAAPAPRSRRARSCPSVSTRPRSARPCRRLPASYDRALAGSPAIFGTTISIGERIDHIDGMTIEEAEHQMATRLYQNTAHPLQPAHGSARPLRAPPRLWRSRHLAGPRAVLQRARQRLPCCRHQRRPACCTSIRGRHRLCLVGGAGQGRDRRATDIGALRVRMIATKNLPCALPIQDGIGRVCGRRHPRP